MIYSFDEDFSKVIFFTTQIGILDVDLEKINLDDGNNFDEDDHDTIIHIRFLVWCNKFETRKALKQDISK